MLCKNATEITYIYIIQPGSNELKSERFQSIDGSNSRLNKFGMKELFKRGGDSPPISRKASSAGTVHHVISGLLFSNASFYFIHFYS